MIKNNTQQKKKNLKKKNQTKPKNKNQIEKIEIVFLSV